MFPQNTPNTRYHHFIEQYHRDDTKSDDTTGEIGLLELSDYLGDHVNSIMRCDWSDNCSYEYSYTLRGMCVRDVCFKHSLRSG